VLAGIEKVTAETGYDLIITHAGESSEKEAANALNLFHKRVDGVIASLAIETKTLDHFTPFIEKEIPVIFFDRVEEFNKMPKVIIDNYKCGYIATRHLIEQGCTRIAHITSSLNRNVYAQRYLGYRSALEENGIAFQEEWLIINDLKEESAIASAQKLLTLPQFPDGVFITNDFVSAVVMQALKESNIRIPEQIAIVGFNNDSIGKLVSPRLTTINYPGSKIGEVAARSLINHLNGTGKIEQEETIIVNSELIVRESSLRKQL
jgi:LacI family transcriptional regulator